MKTVRRVVLTCIVAAVVAGGVWIAMLVTDWPRGASQSLNPFSPKIHSTSEAVLSEVQDLLQLRTVEYIYKTVFPYDFVPPNMDWKDLTARRANGYRLSPSEEILVDRYDFCKEVGIDLAASRKEFVVVTSIVHGGFDLSEAGSDLAVRAEDDMLIIDLPDPEILEVIVEDSRSEDYGYPDISMSPENWKRVTAFVNDHVVAEVLGDGILSTAQVNGEEFIERIFTNAGWSAVSFE